MSKRYTHEQKHLALKALTENHGDITLTAIQTGIPERTLRDWRLEHQPDFPPPKIFPAAAATAATNPEQPAPPPNEYAQLRQRLMAHINHIVDNLHENPETAHHRITALTRLLDRVIRLESLIPRLDRTPRTIRVEYKYPDGTINETPPWAYKPSLTQQPATTPTAITPQTDTANPQPEPRRLSLLDPPPHLTPYPGMEPPDDPL